MIEKDLHYYDVAITGDRRLLDQLYDTFDNCAAICDKYREQFPANRRFSDILTNLFKPEANLPDYRIFLQDLNRLTTEIDWLASNIALTPKQLPENRDAVHITVKARHGELVTFLQKFADVFGATCYLSEQPDRDLCCTTAYHPAPSARPAKHPENLLRKA